MTCKTISVLGAATQQVAIPSRLPQSQADWQAVVQQLNSLFTQLATTAGRPAATSVPVQYATLFSATLPPLQTTNCTVTADNSWTLFGGYSYKVSVTGPNASIVFGSSGFPLPIPPNENWLASVYGKCSGASQSFKVSLQTTNGVYGNTVITDAIAATVDRFAIPLNMAADDASQCTLRLDFPSASGKTFWFDGFQYEPSVSGSINPSPFLSTNIIAGSIVAQFITVENLAALSANMGTLTAGKIQSSDGRFTIDCTGELITITDGTNTRMQIGQISSGAYDVKIWNASGVLLFDAASGLQYAGNSPQVSQVVGNNSGNGQLNVNPVGGVTNQLPHPNQSAQVLQVIANNSGNGQLNVSPTGGVTSQLPHANHSPQVLNVITNNSGNGQLNVSPTGGVTSTLPYANHAPSVKTTIVNTPDGNGSYLGHGVVFQPHINPHQIGWGHFVGDTSGNYSGNLVDAGNLRFLHGAMSGAVQTTVQSSPDTNGSYLSHGTVFQPHISANQIGFGHFKGDTSGNYTGNLVDAGNLRFLHGAMSTGVQGVISSGSQVNVNPSGGVTGNLPYSNHDISVRNTLASTVGGDGSYLNPGQVFNRHLNNANQDGLADGSTRGATLLSVLTGNVPDLNKGILNKTLNNLTYPTLGLRADLYSPSSSGSITMTSANTTGWFGAATFYSLSGRGHWQLRASIVGGGAAPVSALFDVNVDWAGNITLHLISGNLQASSITSARAVTDSTNGWTQLQLYCTAPSTSYTINLNVILYAQESVLPSLLTFGGAANNTSGLSVATLTNTNSRLSSAATQAITDAFFIPNQISTAPIAQGDIDVTGGTHKHKVTLPNTGLYAYANFGDNTPGGHVGKIIDNINDGTTYARTLASVQTNNIPDLNLGILSKTQYTSGLGISGAIQTSKTSVLDGGSVTFDTAFTNTPEVLWLDGGLTYDSTLTGQQYQAFTETFTISGGSYTGFTASLKISTVGGPVINQSQNFSSNSVTLPTITDTIINGAFTASGNVANSQSEINAITVTLTDTTHSKSWNKLVTVPASGTKPFSINATDTSATSGTVFTLSYTTGGSTSGTATLAYQTQTAPTQHTATPAGVPGVNWIAFAMS